MRPVAESCAGCGLVIAGGGEACQALFEQQLALHYADVTYFAIHRLFVDCYSLQHADESSFKSVAAHLMHLCWSLEQGGSRAVPSEPIRRWVERNPGVQKPELPPTRGVVTIAHVGAAASAQAHRMAVDLWARSVWEAYSALQPLVREWVKAALEQKGVTRHH